MEPNISKPTACFLAVAFIGTLNGVFLNDLLSGTYADLLDEHPPRTETLLDGSFAKSVDEYLETDSATMRSTRSAWNGTLLNWFDEAPNEVCVGHDDYLFLTASLQPVVEPTATRSWNDILTMIETVDEGTRATGGRLRVLVMPAKWRLHEDKLRGRGPGPRRRALYAKATHALRRKGIDAPDLLSALLAYQAVNPDKALYPPTDSHFSRLGFAYVTTHFVADLAGVSVNAAEAKLRTLHTKNSVYQGDLVRVMNIAADSQAGRRFEFKEQQSLAPACFDQKEAQILVLGDSFFRTYDGLLQRLIQTATDQTVDSRFAGWGGLNIRRLASDYEKKPASIVVVAITERLFATF